MRRQRRLSNRKGFTLILCVLMLTIFIGAAAMAVDIGHSRLNRADDHAASDAASLAAIEEYGEVSRADSALAEAQWFARQFLADTAHLAVAPADFALGFWSGTAFTAGGTDTNAAQVTVRHTTNYVFGSLFGFASHDGSATSVAVGGVNKSVTKSSCVAPAVVSYQMLLDQLGGGLGMNHKLTPADIKKLAQATASSAVSFDIPNGVKVTSLDENEFYQVNVPPSVTADGTLQTAGPPSASDYENGVTCTGGSYDVGVGDWVQPINGQKANKTQNAIDAIGPLPVTIEVIVADQFGTPNGCASGSGSSALSGCFHVAYLGSLTITGTAGKGVTGYFTILSPPAASVVATDTTSGPVTLQTRTRLVY